MSQHKNMPLIAAIVFSAVAVSGSLVFFALQMTGAPLASSSAMNMQAEIEKGIKTFVEQQRMEEEKAQRARFIHPIENFEAKPRAEDFVKGNKDAVISLIEYSDFDCPYCRAVHPTLNQVVSSYNGQVNWIYRDYPLPIHDPSATEKAVASRCAGEIAGQEAYWQFVDKLFEDPAASKGEENLKSLAQAQGLSASKFAACVKDPAKKTAIAGSILEGSLAGVDGTPGSILYNTKTGKATFVSGAQQFETFKEEIDALLE